MTGETQRPKEGRRSCALALGLLLLAQGQVGTLERAAALVREGRVAEAEQQLTAVLKAAPEEAGALNLLGTIRAQQGRLDEAESLFARAIRSDPRFVGPRMNIAYLYMLKGAPEKTIGELREVVRLEPANVDATAKLSSLLLAQKRLDEALAVLEAAKLHSPPAPLLVLLGDVYAAKGDAAKAEESYLLALDRDAGSAAALLALAESSRRKGDAGAVSAYLARARASAPESRAFLYRYALVALKSGMNEEALTALGRASELEPGDAPTLLLLGIAWLRKPDLTGAEQTFRRLLEVRPGDAQGQLFLGYVLLKLKRIAEARELLERSVPADAAVPEGHYYLGLIAQEQRDDARAVELFEKVVARFPDYHHARVALGVSLMRLKDFTRARQELERAIAQSPGDQKAHYNLALLYARLKEPERAQEQMRIVEELKIKSGARTDEDEISTPSVPDLP
jgi:tetratricopeptide (TPR) repeat protein